MRGAVGYNAWFSNVGVEHICASEIEPYDGESFKLSMTLTLNKTNITRIFSKEWELLSARKFAVRVSVRMFIAIVFCGVQVRADWWVEYSVGAQKHGFPARSQSFATREKAVAAGQSSGVVWTLRGFDSPSPAELEANQMFQQAKDAFAKGFLENAARLYDAAADKYSLANDAQNSGIARGNAAIARENQRIANTAAFMKHKSAHEKALLQEAAIAKRDRNWDRVIELYRDLQSLEPAISSYRENEVIARSNKRMDQENQRRAAEQAVSDAVEILRSKAWKDARYAFNKKKDYPEALRLFFQAQALRNDPQLEGYILASMVQIPLEAAYTASGKKDDSKALSFFLQAQALRNDPNLEMNIKNLRDNGVVPMEPGLTPPVFPVGPSDKADALFKLRVEKAFSDQPSIGLQQLKEKSAFIFDAGRVTNPAALPEVNEPLGKFVEKAISLARAALVIPRAASERADAPPVIKENSRLRNYSEQQSNTVAAYERALKKQKELFQQGDKATPEDLNKNIADISKLGSDLAFTHAMEKAAGGSKGGGSEDTDLTIRPKSRRTSTSSIVVPTPNHAKP